MVARKEQSSPTQTEAAVTREEVRDTLSAIARRVVDTQTAYVHAMLTLDHLLRLPNAGDLFDADLRQQARDIWVKLKSVGLQLNDPPVLFGVGEAVDGVTSGGDRNGKQNASAASRAGGQSG